MARKGISSIKWFEKTISAKSATIRLNQRGLAKLANTYGVTLAKGQKSFTVTGSPTKLVETYGIQKRRINQYKGVDTPKYTYPGIQTTKATSITFTSSGGKVAAAGSKGKTLSRVEEALGISKRDDTVFRNFGLRADGSPRLGYTLAQCLFSFEFRRAGSVASARYSGGGNPRKSVLNRVRGKFAMNGYIPPKTADEGALMAATLSPEGVRDYYSRPVGDRPNFNVMDLNGPRLQHVRDDRV